MGCHSLNIPDPALFDKKFYGPPALKKGTREAYKHVFSETVSLLDSVVYDANIAALTKAAQSPKGLSPDRVKVVKRILRTQVDLKETMPEKTRLERVVEAVKREVDRNKTFDTIVLVDSLAEKNEWLNPVTLVEKYAPMIKEHVARRVDNFLLQLAGGCFGSKLHFEVGKTQNQGESVAHLHVDYNGVLTKVCVRNAAHSSTFPNLIAYDGAAWDLYTSGNGEKPEGVDFLKDSDNYRGMNSTMAMPISVNQADIEIDGTRHNSSFSIEALKLINESAKGLITLETAISEFLESLENMINKKIDLRVKNPGVNKALLIYREAMVDIIDAYNSNPESWIFTQLNLMIDAESLTDNLKGSILRLRSEAIQRNMRGQSEIMNKVNTLSNKILTKFSTAPANYKQAFKALVIENMSTPEGKLRVSTLFAMNDPQAQGVRPVNLSTTKEKIISVAKAQIKSLCKEIKNDMRTMRNEEEGHRGDSMRILRESKEWTQVELGNELKARYPSQFSSQSTMCRTERGDRKMDNALATQLSKIFNVPKELLLPQFFYI